MDCINGIVSRLPPATLVHSWSLGTSFCGHAYARLHVLPPPGSLVIRSAVFPFSLWKWIDLETYLRTPWPLPILLSCVQKDLCLTEQTDLSYGGLYGTSTYSYSFALKKLKEKDIWWTFIVTKQFTEVMKTTSVINSPLVWDTFRESMH